MQPAVPGVEVADHADRARRRRPHRECGAGHALVLSDVGPEPVVELLVAALADQVLVELADRGHERVGILDREFAGLAVIDLAPVVERELGVLEPARPLPERRQKRSPLRDVAGMLRSFAYVTSAVELLRGQAAPEGYEERMREQFLSAYFAAIEATLIPAGEAAITNLLSIYELEKAIYELRYELNNRPDWVSIPVAGIVRMLDEEVPV